jgi:hypothetical protein
MAAASFFNRTTTRSVREKVGFGFDANSWEIAKVKKICGKNLLKIVGNLLRICVTA